VIDTTNQTLLTNLPVATHPEALEIDNDNDRIFVNVAEAAEVVVIDGTSHTQTATWKLTRAKDNVPLVYDQENQVLFVACRTPARLLVLDGKSGGELADLPSDAGADDLFYDPATHRVYLIAGSGAVDVYEIDAERTVRAIGNHSHLPRGQDRIAGAVAACSLRRGPGYRRQAGSRYSTTRPGSRRPYTMPNDSPQWLLLRYVHCSRASGLWFLRSLAQGAENPAPS
jgi:hypothetical protein